jgi:hypothetical protein
VKNSAKRPEALRSSPISGGSAPSGAAEWRGGMARYPSARIM